MFCLYVPLIYSMYPVNVICSSPRAVFAFCFHPTILCQNSAVPRNGCDSSPCHRPFVVSTVNHDVTTGRFTMLLLLDGLPSCYFWTVYHAVITGRFSVLSSLDGVPCCYYSTVYHAVVSFRGNVCYFVGRFRCGRSRPKGCRKGSSVVSKEISLRASSA